MTQSNVLGLLLSTLEGDELARNSLADVLEENGKVELASTLRRGVLEINPAFHGIPMRWSFEPDAIRDVLADDGRLTQASNEQLAQVGDKAMELGYADRVNLLLQTFEHVMRYQPGVDEPIYWFEYVSDTDDDEDDADVQVTDTVSLRDELQTLLDRLNISGRYELPTVEMIMAALKPHEQQDYDLPNGRLYVGMELSQ